MMKTPTVRLGFTGCGGRGRGLVDTCTNLDAVEIVALCSNTQEPLAATREDVVDAGRPEPATYEDHDRMVETADLDAVVIATPWEYHLPMAITALEADVSVGLEVGPAQSLDECWELVRTAEASDGHCMLLENCCYGRDELAAYRMVRGGVFGEVVHCECGYGHDLRGRLVTGSETSEQEGATLDWRGRHHANRNGDLYPTHGVGPIAKLLDVNQGNRFVSLTATSSKAAGLDAWAETNLPAEHPARSVEWNHGDVVTSILECANGETVEVTHDVSLPRPYSRMYTVQGTNGIWQHRGRSADSDDVYVEGESPEHQWESFDSYREEWQHPIWQSYLEEGTKGGHGGIDYLVLRAFVESVANEERPPIDVYDTATWRAISVLSAESIETKETVAFPDFTNGQWTARETTFPLID
jgi:predicted dehydrogenase